MIYDSLWLRRLAYLGARYGSRGFVARSPAVIGTAFSAVLVRHRLAVQRNLRLILGRRDFLSEQRDITRTFSEYAYCLTESLGFERVGKRGIRYAIKGEQHLRSLGEHAPGFVVLTAHAGAWDLAANHLREQLGRPVMIAMRREPNAGARDFQDQLRARRGIEVAHVGENVFEGLALLRHLREGGVIAVQLDRVPAGARELGLTLFGGPFGVPLGPFKLASLAKVPLVPIFCARLGHFEYEVTVSAPIRVGVRPTREQLVVAARYAVTELERFLRQYPTQWFNFEREHTSQRNGYAPKGEPAGS